jgi:uncharacterized membrane protein (DUF2068 family)
VTDSTAAPAKKRELAIRLIIFEKGIKAALVLVVACVFGFMLLTGTSVHLHGIATHLREHVTAAWAVYAADAIVSATDRRKLAVITSAMFLDAITTSLEWYALLRGKRWGEWLVVAAMSALIPFEVVSFAREQHAGRLVVLLGNVAIVAYLARHASRRQPEHAA